MNDWRHCIICHVDLIGIKDKANIESKISMNKMLTFHALAKSQIASMPRHEHVYTWNDSAAFVSYPNGHSNDYRQISKELCDFLNEAEKICRCYAVMVKGKAFPAPLHTPRQTAKYTFLTLSSWAFANCFKIEKELGTNRKRMYVDGRIVRAGKLKPGDKIETITMYPKYYARDIHMYNGNII